MIVESAKIFIEKKPCSRRIRNVCYFLTNSECFGFPLTDVVESFIAKIWFFSILLKSLLRKQLESEQIRLQFPVSCLRSRLLPSPTCFSPISVKQMFPSSALSSVRAAVSLHALFAVFSRTLRISSPLLLPNFVQNFQGMSAHPSIVPTTCSTPSLSSSLVSIPSVNDEFSFATSADRRLVFVHFSIY